MSEQWGQWTERQQQWTHPCDQWTQHEVIHTGHKLLRLHPHCGSGRWLSAEPPGSTHRQLIPDQLTAVCRQLWQLKCSGRTPSTAVFSRTDSTTVSIHKTHGTGHCHLWHDDARRQHHSRIKVTQTQRYSYSPPRSSAAKASADQRAPPSPFSPAPPPAPPPPTHAERVAPCWREQG